MSVAGISSSLPSFQTSGTQSTAPTRPQQFRQELQQLGQDLQSGNLSAATADFSTLQKLEPQQGSTATWFQNSPIGQAFNQLSQDLQSGNLSGAQQDYATIQQDMQKNAAHGHHHHRVEDPGSAVSQAFQQLGQALQSGNLTSAQQAYATLQQDFPQLAQASGQSAQSSSQPNTSTVSVNA